jgi:hypothetical protein
MQYQSCNALQVGELRTDSSFSVRASLDRESSFHSDSITRLSSVVFEGEISKCSFVAIIFECACIKFQDRSRFNNSADIEH